MSARYTAPRGTNDFAFDRSRRIVDVLAAARQTAELYGYAPVETPIFEASEVFARSIGEETDIVSKEMYTFQDRKGRSLTLRPEGTAGVVRAYIENNWGAQGPVRLWYYGPMFRYERPQAGRYRQFFQFGIEALGDPSPVLDAQVIELCIGIGHRLGLTGLTADINSVGCPDCRRAYGETLRGRFAPRSGELCADCVRRLERNPLRVLDCKVAGCQAVYAGAPSILEALCAPCRAHHDTLRRALGDLDIPFRENPKLVRGLDYYTRTAFEVLIPGHEGSQNALGGGGRYDRLVELMGGKPTPGIGFAIGVERLAALLDARAVGLTQSAPGKVYLAALGDAARARALKLAAQMRREGVCAVVDGSSDGLGRQLKSAHREGASLALILGDTELARGVVAVKDMASGQQDEVALDGAVRVLVARVRTAGPSAGAPEAAGAQGGHDAPGATGATGATGGRGAPSATEVPADRAARSDPGAQR